MIMINPRAMADVARIQKKLLKASKEIKIDSETKVQEVGQLGLNWALNLAPHYTGALKAAIKLELPMPSEARITSSRPSGDTIPIQVMFDEGSYPNPRSIGLGFMKETAIFLQTEFSNRLKLSVARNIEKIGSAK